MQQSYPSSIAALFPRHQSILIQLSKNILVRTRLLMENIHIVVRGRGWLKNSQGRGNRKGIRQMSNTINQKEKKTNKDQYQTSKEEQWHPCYQQLKQLQNQPIDSYGVNVIHKKQELSDQLQMIMTSRRGTNQSSKSNGMSEMDKNMPNQWKGYLKNINTAKTDLSANTNSSKLFYTGQSFKRCPPPSPIQQLLTLSLQLPLETLMELTIRPNQLFNNTPTNSHNMQSLLEGVYQEKARELREVQELKALWKEQNNQTNNIEIV